MVLLLLGVGAIAYGSICLLLYWRQTRLIFLPSPLIEVTPQELGLAYEDVWLPIPNDPNQRIHGWWIPAKGQAVGTLLYLHGNGSNVGGNLGQAAIFQQMGFSVLLIDYRGYGRSEGGFPHEAQVYEDARLAWAYLVQQRQIPPEQIFIYGHSLGGAIAIDLAMNSPQAAALIIQSSFTSMRDVVNRTTRYEVFPIDLILTQRFDSIQKISQLQMPILFIHGQADEQIPADMSIALYDRTTAPKQLWLVPHAGHNNVANTAGAEYFQVVETFVRRVVQGWNIVRSKA